MEKKYSRKRFGSLFLFFIKFRFSNKATKFETISHMIDVYLVTVKSSVRLFQIFVALSECLNFTIYHVIVVIKF
jgi:hypothetical protein